MSDVSQGPDWWLASDGKWYPPAAGSAPADRSCSSCDNPLDPAARFCDRCGMKVASATEATPTPTPPPAPAPAVASTTAPTPAPIVVPATPPAPAPAPIVVPAQPQQSNDPPPTGGASGRTATIALGGILAIVAGVISTGFYLVDISGQLGALDSITAFGFCGGLIAIGVTTVMNLAPRSTAAGGLGVAVAVLLLQMLGRYAPDLVLFSEIMRRIPFVRANIYHEWVVAVIVLLLLVALTLLTIPPKPAGEPQIRPEDRCSPGARVGAAVIDNVLFFALLGIGWLIWAAVSFRRGQTPGKQIIGLVTVDSYTGERATFGAMCARELLFKRLINTISFGIIGFISAILILMGEGAAWDRWLLQDVVPADRMR